MKNKNDSHKSFVSKIGSGLYKIGELHCKFASKFEKTITDILGIEYNVIEKPFGISCDNNLKNTQTSKNKTI